MFSCSTTNHLIFLQPFQLETLQARSVGSYPALRNCPDTIFENSRILGLTRQGQLKMEAWRVLLLLLHLLWGILDGIH
jgi:hypothetical protein